MMRLLQVCALMTADCHGDDLLHQQLMTADCHRDYLLHQQLIAMEMTSSISS
jgi:hypothetical protein